MSYNEQKPDLKLAPHLATIVEQDYPRFSAAEIARRRALMEQAMARSGVDHLIAYAAFFSGGPVHWLSDWSTTYEAALVLSPGRPDTLFVQFYNHLPHARAVMAGTDVRWGGASTIQSVIGELKQRGARSRRVGVVGGLSMGYFKALAAVFDDVVDLNPAYFGMRLVKSREEIDWYRVAGRFGDLAIDALRRELRVGLDEADLGAITESAYVPWRGSNVIHFFGVTSMSDPKVFVPRQHLGRRKLAVGDAISCEITANFWNHGGQVLRTFTLGERFTPLYQKLHDTADAAFDAILGKLCPGCPMRELAIGAKIIKEAGFTYYDDLVHGFGGGYLMPILGSPTRGEEPLPDRTLETGMMMVVQPNVITVDQTAGVQMGELVVVTETGAESLHTAPRGPFHIGV